MTDIRTSVHGCTGLRIESNHPDNNNSITLEFMRDGGSFELTVFGMPASDTRALIAAFADAKTYGTFRRDEDEPEPLDAETIAARRAMYESDLIAAERGHLVGE